MSSAKDILVFGGSGSPRLTERICRHLGIEPGKGEVHRFPEGNLFVRILENVRGRQAFLVQSVAFPANDNFMELLFWVDAFQRASAASVTAVVPYFSYATGDKKDEPRVSIRARVCADALEAAGADRMVTMDLHAPQIQGFFRIPVDALYALPALGEAIRRLELPDVVVVAPDIGFAKAARRYAAFLDTPLAIADKERLDHDGTVVIREIIGDVRRRTAVVVDDFVIRGSTLAKVAERLLERGARSVFAAVTHGVFAEGAAGLIDACPIERLLVTDTVETHPVALPQKADVVSVAPLFGEAIRRIHSRESISVLFPP